jgi:hypothetical protein
MACFTDPKSVPQCLSGTGDHAHARAIGNQQSCYCRAAAHLAANLDTHRNLDANCDSYAATDGASLTPHGHSHPN